MAFFAPTPSFVPIRPRGAVRELPGIDVLVAGPATPPSVPPLSATRQIVAPAAAPTRSRGKPKAKRPMTSSERGIKFRQRQQEKQIALITDNQTLRQQVLRLQALRDMLAQQSLSTPYSTTGAPMRLVMEYFNQFRMGLRVPGTSAAVISGERQRDFLNALVEPGTTFGATPAADLILSIWERYTLFHSSVKLACVSTELISIDNCATVVVHGVLHLRYSRRTIENVFPHAAAEEDLIQKLIGRQLHVRYRAEMHFNERGRLEGYEMSPDFVGALMEILGDLGDCERILGHALIRGHALGEEPEPEAEGMEPVQILSDSESETKETLPTTCAAMEEETTPCTPPQAMDLDYILS